MKIISKLTGLLHIRIFTERPWQYNFHLTNEGKTVEQCLFSTGVECSHCNKDAFSGGRFRDSRTFEFRRWNVGAILRNEDRPIIMDFGNHLFGKIQHMHNLDTPGGNPIQYDLKIDADNGVIEKVDISAIRNIKDNDILRKVNFNLEAVFKKPFIFDSFEKPNGFTAEHEELFHAYCAEVEPPANLSFHIYEVSYK